MPLLAIHLLGCVKALPAAQAPEPWSVGVVSVLASLETGQIVAGPEAFDARMVQELAPRGLSAAPLDEALWLGTFQSRTVSSQRWESLQSVSETDLLLLVETEVRWYSQIAGRFRWTVDVSLRFGPRDNPSDAAEARFQVPVALLFDHQREPEALLEAAPIIERRAAELVDRWLLGHPPTPPAEPAGTAAPTAPFAPR